MKLATRPRFPTPPPGSCSPWTPPLGLRVVYLECDGWVLELLACEDAGVTEHVRGR